MADLRICSVKSCSNPFQARGWCQKHYKRWKTHGNPLAEPVQVPPQGEMEPAEFAAMLRQYLRYDADKGELWWIKKPGFRSSLTKPVGSPNGGGYLRMGFRGRHYHVHRIVFLLAHNRWPTGDLDHINGNPSDNRLTNLREVTHRVNMHNIKRPGVRNTSGFLGVTKVRGRWLAQIHADGRNHSLGSYDTPEEAHQAYLATKRRLHEGCTI